ncbi:MAG TPA: P-II family nitrogen regulator [bacterium]|nr:P-II family nitrogen regulator [bacterium]
MKKIEIIIQSSRFDALKKKLFEAGVAGMTASNVEGYGYQKKRIDVLKNEEVAVELAPRVKVEIVVKDDEADRIIKTAADEVRTGRLGDGKIFIIPVDDAVRIRTGERGNGAV